MSVSALKTEILTTYLTSHSASSVEVSADNGVVKIAIFPEVGVATPSQATLDSIIGLVQDVSTTSLAGNGAVAMATGTVELTGGGSGSVDSIEIGGVEIMSGAENFDTSLAITAVAVADNINAHTSPYSAAVLSGAIITISGPSFDGSDIVTASTTITTDTPTALSGITVKAKVEFDLLKPRQSGVLFGSQPSPDVYWSDT